MFAPDVLLADCVSSFTRDGPDGGGGGGDGNDGDRQIFLVQGQANLPSALRIVTPSVRRLKHRTSPHPYLHSKRTHYHPNLQFFLAIREYVDTPHNM